MEWQTAAWIFVIGGTLFLLLLALTASPTHLLRDLSGEEEEPTPGSIVEGSLTPSEDDPDAS